MGHLHRLLQRLSVLRRVRLRRARRVTESLPIVSLRVAVNPYDTFTGPERGFRATIHSDEGTQVGWVTFGVSPLQDRIYVHKIEIDHTYRGRGYGVAAIWALGCLFGQPITPIHIVGAALSFWERVRALEPCGLVVTEDLRYSDLAGERRRWRQAPI